MAGQPPGDSGIVDTSAALASLYQAPLAEFVARRSALVSQLKKSGHKEVAARLATAAKPSRAAYLVNQVYWRERSSYEAVLEAGTAARAAQQARLLGDASSDLPQALRARDEAVVRATTAAERIAGEDGATGSEATLAQVRGSFEALAAHGREGRLAHGHFTADVALPGLGALAGLTLSPAAATPVRRFEVVARRAESPPPPTPDPRLVKAEARVSSLREREQAVAERAAELERGLAASRAELAQAEAAAAAAARQVEQARRACEKGEAAHGAARRDLEQVQAERVEAEATLAALTTPPEDDGEPGGNRPGRPAARTRRARR